MLDTESSKTNIGALLAPLDTDLRRYDERRGSGLLGTSTTTAAGAVSYTAAGLMANAAFTSLAAQAGITLINNQGNLGKTLSDLANSHTAKAALTAALTAGVLDGLNALPEMQTLRNKLSLTDASLVDKFTYNLVNATGRALTDAAINGGSLESALNAALVGGVVDTAQGAASSQIKGLENQYVLHKLAHALSGCVAGAAAGSNCQDGAIGAVVGEMVAKLMPPANGMFYTDAEKVKVLAYGKLVAGGVSAYTGGDAQTAITTAETAMQNNAFMIPPLVAWLASAAAGYTAGTGGGNPVAGLATIGQGADPLSQALANGTQATVALLMQTYPKETTATLNFLAATGQAVDATISYVDSLTGQTVSSAWNSLSADTRNTLIGTGKVVGVVLTPVSVGQVKTLASNIPKFTPSAKLVATSQQYNVEISRLQAAGQLPNNVLQEITLAEKANWKAPDGSNLLPPLGGKVPGTIENVTLPPGTMLDRYGKTSNTSSYLAPAGTPFEQRALPADASKNLFRYEVLKPFPVERSKVLPFYGQPGMGTQFETVTTTGMTIQELVLAGFLKEIK